jgi:hypothetical protein
MKKVYLLSISLLFISLTNISCEKKADNPIVIYEVTTSNENFELSYLDESGNKMQETITTNNWKKSFNGKKGDSVSLSIKSNNLNSKIDAKIIYDGKTIQKGTTYGKFSDEQVTLDLSTTLPY